MNDIISELKRRKVFRVAVMYAAVAFVAAQVADIAFPALHLPGWTVTFVVALAILGFPVALVLAWAFDITPEGVKRTPRRAREGARTQRAVPNAGYLGVGILIGLVAVGAYTGMRVLSPGNELDRSIAVLPFDNLSADPDNAFFASGFHDELITQLAKVSDLTVISRTSVEPYVGSGRNLQEIANALGVRTVMEGSVQRVGNRLRVNARLVDTRTGRPLWTESYDRDAGDAFSIQSALALEIVGALRARMATDERERIEQRPTENAEAYALYLRAREYLARPGHLEENFRPAEKLLQRATELDPSFALAHAELSTIHSAMVWFAHDVSRARGEAARAAADRALALRPDLPEARRALAYYHYRIHRDYPRALDELERARAGLPNDAEVVSALAAVQRRQGRWEEALTNFRRAAELDPRDPGRHLEVAGTYNALRRLDEVGEALQRAAAIAPELPVIRAMMAVHQLEVTGDPAGMVEFVETSPPGFDPGGQVTAMRASLAFNDGGAEKALAILEDFRQNAYAGQTRYWPRTLPIGLMRLRVGDLEGGRQALHESLRHLQQIARERPDDSRIHNALGMTYAGLGQREDALREAQRARQLLAARPDAMQGPEIETDAAIVHAWAGDLDGAVREIERLARVPGGPTPVWLRLGAEFEPLRNHAGFRRLAGL